MKEGDSQAGRPHGTQAKVIRAAIRKAVQDCKAKGYFLDYWSKMTEEEMGMFEGEWDRDTALEVRWEEGWGRRIGKGLWKKGTGICLPLSTRGTR